MAYTVQKLANLSGVSVRTLHYYDEIGLLKPAYIEVNGYRYYEEKQLILLQQILFFRELGIELKKIHKILGKGDFDKIAALRSHKKILEANIERTKELIQTIDKTIGHLTGEKKIKEKEFYHGFITKEKQKEYETYLRNLLGKDHPSLTEYEKNSKNFSQENATEAAQECDVIFKKLAEQRDSHLPPSAAEVQSTILQLYNWIKQFWTPDKISFIGLGQMYTELEWKIFFEKYDSHHPQLALYVAEAMNIFADQKLGA